MLTNHSRPHEMQKKNVFTSFLAFWWVTKFCLKMKNIGHLKLFIIKQRFSLLFHFKDFETYSIFSFLNLILEPLKSKKKSRVFFCSHTVCYNRSAPEQSKKEKKVFSIFHVTLRNFFCIASSNFRKRPKIRTS